MNKNEFFCKRAAPDVSNSVKKLKTHFLYVYVIKISFFKILGKKQTRM